MQPESTPDHKQMRRQRWPLPELVTWRRRGRPALEHLTHAERPSAASAIVVPTIIRPAVAALGCDTCWRTRIPLTAEAKALGDAMPELNQ